MSGFIQLERSFFNTPQWKEERSLSHAEAMLYLIGKAGFEARTVLINGVYIHLQAGELIASVRFLAEKFSWSKNKVNRFLERLVKIGYISRRIEKKESLIKLKRFIQSAETANGTVKKPLNYLIDNVNKTTVLDHSGQLWDSDGTMTGQLWDSDGTMTGQLWDSDGTTINKVNNNNNINKYPPYSPPMDLEVGSSCSKTEKQEKEKSCIKKEKSCAKKEKIELPFSSERFAKAWKEWKEYKAKEHGFRYKSSISEKGALTQLKNKSQNKEPLALAIIEQSIANGWEGMFALKAEDLNEQKNLYDLPPKDSHIRKLG